MANSGIYWIDITFDYCVRLLYQVAGIMGITYEEINVWLFVIILPAILLFSFTLNLYFILRLNQKNKINDVAIVRIEQLFPLPEKEIMKIISDYNPKEIVWAQEEPRNMGPWSHLLMHLDIAKNFRVASRRFYGSPASGSSKRFEKRHKEVIEYVFDKTKNNFR